MCPIVKNLMAAIPSIEKFLCSSADVSFLTAGVQFSAALTKAKTAVTDGQEQIGGSALATALYVTLPGKAAASTRRNVPPES